MSIENEQKVETTCNPCDSVVTIHVNKDAICGDSGKPKVDNQTISYNDKGELQWGTTKRSLNNEIGKSISFTLENDNYDLEYVKEYNPINVREDVRINKTDTKESFLKYFDYEAGGFVDNLLVQGEYQSISRSESLGMGGYYNLYDFYAEGVGVNKQTNFNPERVFVSLNVSSKNRHIEFDKKMYSSVDSNVLDEVIRVSNTDKNILKRIINKDYNHSFDTDFDFDLRAKKVRVNDKDVITSINGTLANESGELVFEEFPNGVVLQSPNQSKYRVTVGDDGSLTTTKLQ
ncbi:hypothetical protein ACKLNQ_02290 [Myroides odoratimimus]|uniref:hypothetical protein n=1 Tax=Myroides odoratimimus TaxID=76832 RepID=UPI0038D47331